MEDSIFGKLAVFYFIRKLLLFSLPVVSVYLLPLGVVVIGGELNTLEKTIITQQRNHTLFGLAYSYADREYKFELAVARKAPVLALGTSRVMQFRSIFFKHHEQFTNAGGAMPALEDALPFLQRLPKGSRPQILIIGIDQNFFKPFSPLPTSQQVAPMDRVAIFFESKWRDIYRDFFSGKLSMRNLFEISRIREDIGINALLHDNGFRFDGSYRYGLKSREKLHAETLREEELSIMSEIRANRSSFLFGTSTAPRKIGHLTDILEWCHSEGIEVVGIMPPVSGPVLHDFLTVEDEYSLQAQRLYQDVNKVFQKYKFTLFDFTKPDSADIELSEFVDPAHGSDRAYARMLLVMSMKSPALARYVDSGRIRSMLQSQTGDFLQEE